MRRKPDFLAWLQQCPPEIDRRAATLTLTLKVSDWLMLASVAAHEGKEIHEIVERIISESDDLSNDSMMMDMEKKD